MEQDFLDENTKTAINFSIQSALKNGEFTLTTGYVLYGLLKTDTSVVNQAFIRLGITPEKAITMLYEVRRNIEMEKSTSFNPENPIEDSDYLKKAYNNALTYVQDNNSMIKTEDLLIGLLKIKECEANIIIQSFGIKERHIKEKIDYLINRSAVPIAGSESKPVIKSSYLTQISTDLTLLAKMDKLDPVFGREKEINRAISILLRRSKNNPIFIGEAGVGKTAIVEGIAQEIAKGHVPNILKNKKIFSIEISTLLAGTKFRGEFEERLNNIVNEVKNDPNIILFIDEIHTLIGAGNAEGALDAANILKPALARGKIQCIGATTFKEYQAIEKDGALERRFQPITVEEPTIEEAEKILFRLKKKYEQHHDIQITDGAIRKAVLLSSRFIPDRFLPDKSIDLIDESASLLRLNAYQENANASKLSLEDKDIANTLSSWTGIPLDRINKEETTNLLDLESKLQRKVIGQDSAIKKIVESIIRSRVGLKKINKPIGSFIFSGSTGVGKTFLAKQLASHLFGDERAIIRIDMSEYMDLHSISRLIGAAPGLVGYEDGGILTDQIRKKPYSIVLFDEIEKAHPEFFNLLLQVLDEGRLTNSKGRTVSFSNSIIIFTSNIGGNKRGNKGLMGFQNSKYDETNSEELKRFFKPEFLSRIDEVITFNDINETHLMNIIDLQLTELYNRLNEINITIRFTLEAKNHMLLNGFSLEMGVRSLHTYLRNTIERLISYSILKQEIKSGDFIEIEVKNSELILKKVNAKINEPHDCIS